MKSIIISVIYCLGLLATTAAQTGFTDTFALKGSVYLDYSNALYNPARAFNYYTRSAALGNSKSMNAIGVMYKLGMGVETNEQKATEYFTKASNAGYITAWYNLGLVYKEKLRYDVAYKYFAKGAILQDPQATYAQGYMLYKGFGCQQDYRQAMQFFSKGASMGKASCMYFLGLCYRNGYGVAANKDSARYWLMAASDKGYTMAKDELMSREPENHISGKALAEKIKAAQQESLSQKESAINTYQKIAHSLPVSDVAGTYEGYLLKYDYSGVHIIEANKLSLTLYADKDTVKGTWLEDDTLAIPIRAYASANGLLFDKMEYYKTTHYHTVIPDHLLFEKAAIKMIKKEDGTYLAGNIQQYRVEQNEPAKPLYMALAKTGSSTTDNRTLKLLNGDGTLLTSSPLRAYPNPFGRNISVVFELKAACKVSTQLQTMDGKVVYSKPAQFLEVGNYTINLESGNIAAGYYILSLRCGNKIRTAKVVKL